MHQTTLAEIEHSHTFGTAEATSGEQRTHWVIAITAAMMVIEIAAGMAFGSMALLADGWHMSTHAAALSITAFAYRYARRHAGNARYSFGTGKVGALGGFGSAVALGVVALGVLGESLARCWSPVPIRFDEAIAVVIVGLGVNLLSAVLLRDGGHGHAGHDHEHDHANGLHHDHNLRAAYMHVLADALTSVLALVALVAGKYLNWMWLDPFIGVVGGLIIARWSLGLLRDTSRVLLDAEIDERERTELRHLVEADGDNRVADLHLWRVGPRHLAAIVSIVTHNPREPRYYKDLLRRRADLVHVTIEVERCPGDRCAS